MRYHLELLSIASLAALAGCAGGSRAEQQAKQEDSVDAVIRRQIAASDSARAADAARGKWRIWNGYNDDNNDGHLRREVKMTLEATTGQSAAQTEDLRQFGMPVAGIHDGSPFTLTLLCITDTVEAYIDWHTYLSGDDNIDVTTRFDQAPIRAMKWHVVGFAPPNQITRYQNNDARSFIKKLLSASSFEARVRPDNYVNSITGTWDLTGLTTAIVPLQRTCNGGWD
jgi:hypothetical protein